MPLLVNIDVPDLFEGERFYVSAFGLAPARRFAGHTLELSGWPAPVYLLHKPAGTVAAAADRRRYERHWTPVHLDIAVRAIEEAVDRAVRAGATLEQPITAQAYGRIAMLADPFGHGFCLIEFGPEGYDALSGPACATAPDIDSELPKRD